MLADADRRFRGHPGGADREQIFFVFHQKIHVVDVDEALSHDPRHAWVDLGDDQIGGAGCRHGHVNRDAETHPAKVVDGGHLNQGDIEVELTPGEKPWDVRHVHRGDEAALLGDGQVDG